MAKKLNWHKVEKSQLKEILAKDRQLAMAELRLEGKRIILLNADEKWYALDAKCPHQGGPFSKGMIDEGFVICPWHRFAFDLQTGQCTSGGYYIDTYEVKEENGNFFIGIPQNNPWWKFNW